RSTSKSPTSRLARADHFFPWFPCLQAHPLVRFEMFGVVRSELCTLIAPIRRLSAPVSCESSLWSRYSFARAEDQNERFHSTRLGWALSNMMFVTRKDGLAQNADAIEQDQSVAMLCGTHLRYGVLVYCSRHIALQF